MRRLLYVCLDAGVVLGGTKGSSIHAAELVRAFEAEEVETGVVARRILPSEARLRPTVVADTREAPRRPVRDPVLRRDLREVGARRFLRSQLREAIASFRPDLVYERYALFRTETRHATEEAGIPLVLEVNAPLVEEFSRFRGLALAEAAKRAERHAWRRADLVVTPSQPLAERVRRVGQRRVLVVPNSVDTERFVPGADGCGVRRLLGLDDRFVVVVAGSFKGWRHDLDTLVSALAALSKDLPVTLLVVGDGSERSNVELHAVLLGVDSRFVGRVPHERVPSYLAAADAGVVGIAPDAGLEYAVSMKMLEYLACGLPTVVASIGDHARIADAGAALSYRAGDPVDLARRLREIASDPALGERLARSGRRFAEARTWRAAARAILQAVARERDAIVSA